MTKQKPIVYYNELYRMQFIFLRGWPKAAAETWFKESFGIDKKLSGAGHTCQVVKGEKTVTVIWTERFRETATLAHECLHAVNMTFKDRGVEVSVDNDEPQAYFMSHLMNKAGSP